MRVEEKRGGKEKLTPLKVYISASYEILEQEYLSSLIKRDAALLGPDASPASLASCFTQGHRGEL